MQGTFRAVVTSQALAYSKRKGTPSLQLQCRTKYNIEDPNTPAEFTVFAQLWLTYAAMKNTLKTLQRCFNWQPGDTSELDQQLFRGTEVDLVLEEEEYEGETKTKVKFVNKPRVLEHMDPVEVKALADEVNGLMKQVLQEQDKATPTNDKTLQSFNDQSPTQQPPNHTPQPDTLPDDLPF